MKRHQGRLAGDRGRLPAVLSLLVAFLLAFPSAVPNTPGQLGSLLETFLPWLGLTVPRALGDFNSTVDDRGLAPVTSQLDTTGAGFAFSWPTTAPVARSTRS